jgi:GrpB-like predicted nucleotidyltransferase (UPF0157 family)
LPDPILLLEPDPRWPDIFRDAVGEIRAALGSRALLIEHAGSTAVPGPVAKPVIDVILAVADSRDEDLYLPALEAAGYRLHIREPHWYEHRMFRGSNAGAGTQTNLHVFSSGCPEIARMMLFRDWLRSNPADRDLYARTKLLLARQEWPSVQAYADAKTAVIEEILARAC